MKTISLKITEEVDRRVAAVAHRAGTSKSAIIREAIEERLSNTSHPARASFLDLAGDLVGCISGADDLASNPEHLEGYGR